MNNYIYIFTLIGLGFLSIILGAWHGNLWSVSGMLFLCGAIASFVFALIGINEQYDLEAKEKQNDE